VHDSYKVSIAGTGLLNGCSRNVAAYISGNVDRSNSENCQKNCEETQDRNAKNSEAGF